MLTDLISEHAHNCITMDASYEIGGKRGIQKLPRKEQAEIEHTPTAKAVRFFENMKPIYFGMPLEQFSDIADPRKPFPMMVRSMSTEHKQPILRSKI